MESHRVARTALNLKDRKGNNPSLQDINETIT